MLFRSKLLKYSHQDFERALGKGWAPAIMQRLQEAKAFELRIEELLTENDTRDDLIRQLNEKLKAQTSKINDSNAKVVDLEAKIAEDRNTECDLRIRLAEADKTTAEKTKQITQLQNDLVMTQRENINLTAKMAEKKKLENLKIKNISALEAENGQLRAQVKEMKDINSNLQESNDELTAANESLKAKLEGQEADNLETLNQLTINSPEDQLMTEEQENSLLGSDLRDELSK